MTFCKKYPDCVSDTQRRGSVQSAGPLLCGGTFCRYRTHSAAENEGRTAIERRRNECATVLRKATHCLNRTFRFRFPSLPPYEEHNIDILRKNRVFTRFFAPFWHFGSVTKNHETQIFSGFWWGANACRRSFDPTGKKKSNHKQANEIFFASKRRGG